MLYIYKNYSFFLSLLLLPPFFMYGQEKINELNKGNIVNNNPIISAAAPVFNTEFNPKYITNTTSVIHAIGIKVGDITILIHQMIKDTITKKKLRICKKNH